jgi:hypothetical protein
MGLMSTSLLRPRTATPPTGAGQAAPGVAASPLVAGALAAARAAALSLLACLVVVVLGWATASDTGATAEEAMRTAGQAWLLAHHTVIDVPGGTLGLTPLGLTLVPGLALFAAGRRAVRAGAAPGLRTGGRLVSVVAATYGVLVALVTLAAATEEVRPHPVSAFCGGVVLALLATGLGVLHEGRLAGRLRARLPEHGDAALVGVTGAVAVLLAGGSLLAGLSLAADLRQGAELADALGAGAVGGVLLLLLGVACVPNAVLWATSYAVGPGFAVGSGTVVSPVGVEEGAVPAFPLLAALPQAGAAPGASLVMLGLPVLAGVLAGVLLMRRTWFLSPESAALWGAATGFTAGVCTGLLVAVSGGPLGGGRLSAVGPLAVQVGGLAAVELGLVAAATAWVLARRARVTQQVLGGRAPAAPRGASGRSSKRSS